MNSLPWKQTEITLSFLRLHPSTALRPHNAVLHSLFHFTTLMIRRENATKSKTHSLLKIWQSSENKNHSQFYQVIIIKLGPSVTSSLWSMVIDVDILVYSHTYIHFLCFFWFVLKTIDVMLHILFSPFQGIHGEVFQVAEGLLLMIFSGSIVLLI